ncbi:FecR family protein [Sunxiuqinia sp. A32]|uniref:FecR family protein n=1 Tax=Sunxiuqinia sp. A32 TaxID=3461496 RepID=UPI004045C3AD
MTKIRHNTQQYAEFLQKRKEQDVEAQITEAEVIVHNIDKVDSGKAFALVKKQIQESKGNLRYINILSRVAAILFVPVLIASILFFYKMKNEFGTDQFAMQKISNPLGIRSEIVLPDGSKVWLNAESTISYRIPFDRKTRNVKLIGEAFFDVQKDEHKPFEVESENVSVTVLGTRFNYKAFPEDTVVEVVLEEGKVRLNSIDQKVGGEVIMKPGERAVVNKATYQTELAAEDINKFIGWHEGKLIFDDSPLSDVAKRLERWFGIEVKIADPEIMNNRISTTFENESLRQIVTMLELASPISIKLIPANQDKTSREILIISNNE